MFIRFLLWRQRVFERVTVYCFILLELQLNNRVFYYEVSL